MRFFGLFIIAMTFMCTAQLAQAKSHNFSTWLNTLRVEARAKGISEKTIATALPDTLKPIEKIIRLDKKQPESTRTFAQYLNGVVNTTRLKKGKQRYRDNQLLLSETGKKYGVDPQFIVALWGIETNYGSNTGGFDVVTALATLAFDGRRGKYFRKELFNALKILDEGHITHKDMKGSWAGAMGQTQFMPSSFFNFAQDYNKNGKTDIWTEQEDVFASAANYLSKSGWTYGQPWGYEVTLPKGFNYANMGLKKKHGLDWWQNKGVRRADGSSLPAGNENVSIIQQDGKGTQAYLVYNNFRVIMKWNRSTYFATAVGTLADGVKG